MCLCKMTNAPVNSADLPSTLDQVYCLQDEFFDSFPTYFLLRRRLMPQQVAKDNRLSFTREACQSRNISCTPLKNPFVFKINQLEFRKIFLLPWINLSPFFEWRKYLSGFPLSLTFSTHLLLGVTYMFLRMASSSGRADQTKLTFHQTFHWTFCGELVIRKCLCRNNPFVFNRIPSRIRKNSFILIKSRSREAYYTSSNEWNAARFQYWIRKGTKFVEPWSNFIQHRQTIVT